MTSAAVNKLIRSEIWPLLRAQGFTQFDSRTARRFSEWRTEVVNFQSFNAYAAGVIGCTTYSFAVNLGVHLAGGAGERWMARDKHGRCLPAEYHCEFRTRLLKRTVVDGFASPDIFYVDAEGRTTEAVFREVQELVDGFALRWFAEHADPELLIARTRSDCFVGAILLARLHVLRSPADGVAARAELERTLGYAFDFSPILSSASNAEELSDEICRHPLAPVADWGRVEEPVRVADWKADVVAQLWPRLRQIGFQRFSKSTARRERGGILTMVAVAPMENALRKQAGLPEGLFHVGLGWADLRTVDTPVRRLADCQIIAWLRPSVAPSALALTAFSDMDSVVESMEREGDEWLSVMADPAMAMPFLQLPDWELFRRYPLMRGLGARGSAERYLALAGLARLCGDRDELQRFAAAAETAISMMRESMRPHLLARLGRIASYGS